MTGTETGMDTNREAVAVAEERFGALVRRQLERVEAMKRHGDRPDHDGLRPLVIGVAGGDGIGPVICGQARRVLESLLGASMEKGDVEVRTIEGLTIENRARAGKAIPEDVLAALKECHVILKGPTTTPRKGDPWPNIESANVALRKELDLFANIRPVKVPELGIDCVFFRENTEGAYALGSEGLYVTPDLAMDFTVTTAQGAERIIETAFEYAARHGIDRVTVVTKANVVKTTDGLFLAKAAEVATRYPGVDWDDWYIDIMTAKLLDPARRGQFRVVVLPNLYGDILTDEAAQLQGGVGTAGSANIGTRYAMFEAIHGSAPRMVEEGRADHADPQSMMRATVMLLEHIGRSDEAMRLEMALDICGIHEKKLVITGRPGGTTASEFADYVLKTAADPDLEGRWNRFNLGDISGSD